MATGIRAERGSSSGSEDRLDCIQIVGHSVENIVALLDGQHGPIRLLAIILSRYQNRWRWLVTMHDERHTSEPTPRPCRREVL